MFIIFIMQIGKTITLEENLWTEIEKLRGDVPRSKFIENIIKEKLKYRKNKL